MGKRMRKFLVYTSAGKNSNLRMWVKGDRTFDLWVTNYTDVPSLWRKDADFYNETKGAKFPNFKAMYEQYKDQLAQYSAIMIADDDIVISTEKLNALFELLEKEQFAIVCPAFSRFGKISHKGTERHLRSDYRITNFAEVTCPIFRGDLLCKFMDIYDPNVGQCFGVDWWYLDFLKKDGQHRIAISDSHYCVNPYEFSKGVGVREIDLHYSEDARWRMWDNMKKLLGIDAFTNETYDTKKKRFYKILLDTPMFAAEVIFNYCYNLAKKLPFKSRLKQLLIRH